MTVKPAEDAPMNEQQLRTMVDMIPGLPCRFFTRGPGEMGLVYEKLCPLADIETIDYSVKDRTYLRNESRIMLPGGDVRRIWAGGRTTCNNAGGRCA